MLSLSTRYDLCRLFERWRREKGVADCAASTIRFLMANKLLDEDKVEAFASRETFLNKIEDLMEVKKNAP